jgi:hypothetical protein
MENILNYLPVIIQILVAILVAITAIVEKTRKTKKWTWIIIAMIVLSSVFQILLNIVNNKLEKEKESNTKMENERLNKKSDSLTNVIIFKQDGIKEFIEIYLLNDSILKSKYDSINELIADKDRPILMINKMISNKTNNNNYSLDYNINNIGSRPAANIIGYSYLVAVMKEDFILQGIDTLSIGGTVVISPTLELRMSGGISIYSQIGELDVPAYIFFILSYTDLLIPSHKYVFKVAYHMTVNNYNKNSLNIGLCNPQEQNSLEKFLEIR